jgi:hypothetical protein
MYQLPESVTIASAAVESGETGTYEGYIRPWKTSPYGSCASGGAKDPLPPAPQAHHVEPFAIEDDLLHGLLPAGALALQIVVYPHPAEADLARGVSDDQQHRGNACAIQ